MAEILHITHEAGDLSEYTSTVTDSGDLSVDVTSTLVGSYGLLCTIDDTNNIYGLKSFTTLTSTVFRWRLYFDPNTITATNGVEFATIFKVMNSTSDRVVLTTRKRADGSGYDTRLRVYTDVGNNTTSYYNILDAPNYIEGNVVYASSDVASDATASLWVNGSLQETLTGLDIFDLTKPNTIRAGALGVAAATSGSYFVDDIILRDDNTQIGAAAAATTILPQIMHHYYGS